MATTVLDATGEIIEAVYVALDVASITTTLGCAVYSDVPQGAAFPYLRISDVTARGETLETMGKSADDVLVQVSAFTQGSGSTGARAIRKQAMSLLHNQTLSPTGVTFVSCREVSRGDGADEDIEGVQTYHRWVQVRVHVMES